MSTLPKVGICITTFNSGNVLPKCLESVAESDVLDPYVCIVDSSSTDGSIAQISNKYQCRLDLEIITVGTDYWWTAATNRGIEQCLAVGCDYILLLNPDVTIEANTITSLLQVAKNSPSTISASVVVNVDSRDHVWWAGSLWKPVYRFWPLIWSSRYIVKKGTYLATLPERPYQVSEAHGRAVLIPKEIFESVGLYDQVNFPHYGADTDFSFRVARHGFSILVDPKTIVCLQTDNTGLQHADTLRDAWKGYINYLTKRKNGEAVNVWWKLTQRHLPPVSSVATFLFIIGLNSLRYWNSVLLCQIKRSAAQLEPKA